jgi:hypothetical protein
MGRDCPLEEEGQTLVHVSRIRMKMGVIRPANNNNPRNDFGRELALDFLWSRHTKSL